LGKKNAFAEETQKGDTQIKRRCNFFTKKASIASFGGRGRVNNDKGGKMRRFL